MDETLAAPEVTGAAPNTTGETPAKERFAKAIEEAKAASAG